MSRASLGANISIPPASGIQAGTLAAADFTKLAGVQAGATANSIAVTAPITNAGTALLPVIGIPAATQVAAGYMGAADKVVVDGVGLYQELILGADATPAVAGLVVLSITLGAGFNGGAAYVSAQVEVGDTGAANTFIASIEKGGIAGTLPSGQVSTPGANQFLPISVAGIIPAATSGDVIRVVVYVGTNTGNQRVKAQTTNPVGLQGCSRLTVTRLR